MSNLPLYKGYMKTKVLHRGLLFDKFYEWQKPGEALKEQDKKGFLEKFKGDCGDKNGLERYAKRHLELVDSIGGECMTFSSQWNFVTGMGNDHPLENGFAWHHTLGVPYIAGSAVKGALRAYMLEWTDIETEKILKWFGYTKEILGELEKTPRIKDEIVNLTGESSGSLMFFDAVPVQPVTLTPDVMTPHMGDWYEKGGEDTHDADNTPADWHNPVPILFLAVKKATFLFSIAARDEAAKNDIKEAMGYLGEALEFIGIGAKTAVGYGRFQRDGRLVGDHQEQKKKVIALQQEEQKKQAELEKLSPMDRLFVQIGDEIHTLVKALKDNEFGDDTYTVAQIIKEKMQASKGQWDPNGNKKAAERTKIVQKILGEK